jgi:hypothetical protein
MFLAANCIGKFLNPKPMQYLFNPKPRSGRKLLQKVEATNSLTELVAESGISKTQNFPSSSPP